MPSPPTPPPVSYPSASAYERSWSCTVGVAGDWPRCRSRYASYGFCGDTTLKGALILPLLGIEYGPPIGTDEFNPPPCLVYCPPLGVTEYGPLKPRNGSLWPRSCTDVYTHIRAHVCTLIYIKVFSILRMVHLCTQVSSHMCIHLSVYSLCINIIIYLHLYTT